MIVSKNYRSLYFQKLQELESMIEGEYPYESMRAKLQEIKTLSENIQFKTDGQTDQEILLEMESYTRNNGC